MSGIALGLVDDQFIHGEIGLRWCAVTDAELVIIINDELAKDKLKQGLMDMQIIDTIIPRYYSIETAINKLPVINQKDKKSIVIFDTMEALYSVVDAGVKLNNIIISSVPAALGRRMINHSVALSEAEIKRLSDIEGNGNRIFISSDPDTRNIPLDEIYNLTN
ncbi:PTS sugar transporter subunit IIB [Aerococcaceae bacterium DSM 111022]|nr:PTS sugar transporter subunit IIB [Aerococcaceae bacterium DSM 111022]